MNHMLWIPFITLLWREIRRFMRVFAQTVLTPLINSSLYLTIFGVSLGRSIDAPQDMSYLAFLIPGLVMMSALNGAFQNASGAIVSAKFSGETEDYRSVPLTIEQILWALSCAAVVRAFVIAGVTLSVGESFHYFTTGELLPIQHPIYLLFFLTLGGLIFAHIGIWLAFICKTFDHLSGIGAFILMPLLYLGGVFFSLERLHPMWRALAQFNPVLYLINGVRFGILGYSDVPLAPSMGIALIFLVLIHGVAYRSVAKGSFDRW